MMLVQTYKHLKSSERANERCEAINRIAELIEDCRTCDNLFIRLIQRPRLGAKLCGNCVA
nr:hypothetical protein K4M19_00117 [Agrobacterium fabrum]